MSGNKDKRITRDYYAIVKLGIDDDAELTKQQWCDEKFAEKGAEKHGNQFCLRDRSKDEVLIWTKKTFEPKSEFYVCVIESKKHSKINFPHEELIYLSPHISSRVNIYQKKPNLNEMRVHYNREIQRLISEDQQIALLEMRRKQRENS